MNYWKTCIEEAFDELGIKATAQQIEDAANWVEGAHQNYGMATGNDVADANFISDDKRELEKLKDEVEKRRIWESTTKPCPECWGSGTFLSGRARGFECDYCGGKGRLKI